MENLNGVLSRNLKRIRGEKNLSLDKVSKATGVSKSMLGQIERGESNPTVATVWKIASGLKVSFTSLIKQSQNDFELINKDDLTVLTEDDGRCRAYPFFAFEEGRNFESYKIEMDKDAFLKSTAHSKGVQEYITIYEGVVEIEANNRTFKLGVGDALKFSADVDHSYKNIGDRTVIMNMTIYYPEY